MRTSRWIWGVVGTLSLAATVLLIAGFGLAVRDVLRPQPGGFESLKPVPSPNDPLSDDVVEIVAFGDSLTVGTGDTTGKGYVLNLKEQLEQETGKTVRVLGNYAQDGFKTDDMRKRLDSIGEIRRSVAQADLIVFTIGGNDLFGLARNLNFFEDTFDFGKLEERMPEALDRFDGILKSFAEWNPRATVVYVGLFNPFRDTDDSGLAGKGVALWNAKALERASSYPNTIVVPTYDLFQLNFDQYMSQDHFHPNGDGYREIARRIVQSLK
ncbi:GDSL-type esterase/lipase family protein [Paenibacillus thermoaerophilus]|uniref:GDSL-type esterase/lipase family protein n=1 Tax=Paenibacillus thermoaerophilus TaxID=1215385 RepID=A0ABW2V0E2_9BACL|nr:GDSL-type esterase/lipase family protein [Paenibacillus thermoaerophilus]